MLKRDRPTRTRGRALTRAIVFIDTAPTHEAQDRAAQVRSLAALTHLHAVGLLNDQEFAAKCAALSAASASPSTEAP